MECTLTNYALFLTLWLPALIFYALPKIATSIWGQSEIQPSQTKMESSAIDVTPRLTLQTSRGKSAKICGIQLQLCKISSPDYENLCGFISHNEFKSHNCDCVSLKSKFISQCDFISCYMTLDFISEISFDIKITITRNKVTLCCYVTSQLKLYVSPNCYCISYMTWDLTIDFISPKLLYISQL